MTLRKTTTDNSVKYIAKSERTRDIKPKSINKNLPTRKQNKDISQNNKKFINNIPGEGFGILK